ncbi:hypothetical protein WJX73_000654 [Symbiochloris irregularis]|uniref:Uncharacterized protein n=1 Tax=Symbiochloris irregularis TaxID=706552 RepID=A0AAW1PUV3_9CHLO
MSAKIAARGTMALTAARLTRAANVPVRHVNLTPRSPLASIPAARALSSAVNARPSRGNLRVVASSAEDKVASLDRKSRSLDLAAEQDSRADWSHLLAVVGFVAYWYNKLTVDRMLLLKTLAYLQIFVSVTNLITRYGTLDRVTTVIAPAVLAVFVLNFQISFLDAATALFGYYLAEQIEGPFILWAATLAAALYYGYGTLWYTVAFGVVALVKFLRSIRGENRVPLLSLPVVAASIWAVYTERHFVWTLLLYIAQAAWSGFSTVEKVVAKVEN